jgi:transglutaminase-like putative cysteine protease
MQLRVGCEFEYDSSWPTPAVMLVEPHPDVARQVVRAAWENEPALTVHGYRDLFGNQCRRFVLPAGPARLRYDATVEISGEPDPMRPDARQRPVEELPDEVLVYTLASRYCLSEQLSNAAWQLFGGSEPGWARVQAVCDWIHQHIQYGAKSTPLTTATDVYVARGGICRDFAHLAVTFCRALNIPARYVFGYMPDIGVPPPHPPMDFHAWFEAYLEDRWWTFDARFNLPRIGRVPIGRGRDAVDVAMMTTYGAAQFRRMVVWTDPLDGAAGEAAATPHGVGEGGEAGETSETTEALVLDRGHD